MSALEDDFQTLLQRACAGCPQATAQLHHRFLGHILHAVRRHLNKRLGPKLDPADLAQEVWGEFFSHILPIHRFDNPRHLLTFLGGMVRNMAQEKNRYFLDRPTHDVRREQALDESPALEDHAPGALRRERLERLSAWSD